MSSLVTKCCDGFWIGGKFYENCISRHLKTKNEKIEVDTEGSETVEFYKNKSILITGGLGFMGKVTVEKLLRVCPEIECIYLLVRTKKGKDVEERLEDTLRDPLFSLLKEKNPKFRQKIFPISGDMGLPDLGITDKDKKLLTSKVQIIIHAAASVNLDSKLKSILDVNFFGTKSMVKLARECCVLESFVFVSTAFAHCGLEVVEEKCYQPLISPDEILEMIEGRSDDEVEELVPRLLANTYFNTYQFTKAVTERYLEQNCTELPLVIFRPSIIIPAYKEPLPGWTDNIYGPAGVNTAVEVGLLHTMHVQKHNVADMVPVDYCVNAMLVAATKKSQTVQIYNYTSGCENPIDWSTCMTYWRSFGNEIPTKKIIWMPFISLQPNYYLHCIEAALFHFIPAAIADLLLIVSGRKPKMIKVYKKLHRFLNVVSIIINYNWKWRNDNTQALWRGISKKDRQIFPFSMKTLDWPEYCQLAILGLRMYHVKEDISTVEKGKKKLRILKIAHYTVCCFVALFCTGCCTFCLIKWIP